MDFLDKFLLTLQCPDVCRRVAPWSQCHAVGEEKCQFEGVGWLRASYLVQTRSFYHECSWVLVTSFWSFRKLEYIFILSRRCNTVIVLRESAWFMLVCTYTKFSMPLVIQAIVHVHVLTSLLMQDISNGSPMTSPAKMLSN